MTKFCVLDTETSIGKTIHSGTFRDPKNDIYTLIYGTHPKAINVEHNLQGFKRTLSEGCVKALEQSDCIIAHNAPFDLAYIWHDKSFQAFIKRGGFTWDTQIAEYLMSGQRHAFASLAELQLIYLDKKVKEDRISKLFKKGIGADVIITHKNSHKRIFELFNKYCYGDGSSTFEIAVKQIERAKRLGMVDVIKTYNMYMLALVSTMTTGIKVDLINTEKTLKALKLKSIEFLQKSEEIVSQFWSDPDLPPFNIQSPTHKSALLFGGSIKCKKREDAGFYKNGKPKTKIIETNIEIHGFNLPITLTSPSEVNGRYRTGAEIIEKISNTIEDPLVKQYCKLQKLSMKVEKVCSTYLEPFLNYSIDGILYPHYNNTATATGRLSSSKPNLQNITSKGGMEKYIKNQFIAPVGYKCVSIDFSQLEIYILAMISEDPKLTNDLLDGVDFHILRLSYAEDMAYNDVYKLCKIDKLPEWELKRSKAKTISYQKAYGASPKKLALSTGLDEDVIKKIFTKEDEDYPCVKEFNDKVVSTVNSNKFPSLSKHIPNFRKGFNKYSKRFIGGIELLPIMKDKLNADYINDRFRDIGYYQSITGKRYAFEEMGQYDKFGKVRAGFSPTQMKNYAVQGGAADVVALATSEIFQYILSLNNDDVKMINQVHDSIEFYVKEDKVSLTVPKIKGIMEDIPTLFKKYLKKDAPFKFKVDVKVGNNFYLMENYEA